MYMLPLPSRSPGHVPLEIFFTDGCSEDQPNFSTVDSVAMSIAIYIFINVLMMETACMFHPIIHDG